MPNIRLNIFGFLLFLVSCQTAPSKQKPNTPAPPGMVYIPAGTLHMGGDNEQADGDEYPKHHVEINAFWMDATEVTNRQFKAFVESEEYLTVAERPIDWEIMAQDLPPGTPPPPDSVLQPGSLVFHKTDQPVPFNDPSRWWKWTVGASWRHPEGPGSSIEDRMDHPAVQIAWEDAVAYCEWAGKRLPTEAEWEWAARGGLEDNVYPWGNEDVNEGKPKANFWQGLFPYENSEKDGYFASAPVKSFPPNGYGLYEMPGNVWEWCSDWYHYNYYASSDAKTPNTRGPEISHDPQMPYMKQRSMRGGSFLCNDDFCSGYRNARRMKSSPDTGLGHTGFRCVKEL
ncbi:MAG: formylglycine-generating enzyme family protein [Bacteroidota bacterium]